MANAIRVSDGKRWAYVPAEGEHQARLEQLASAGMAVVSNGAVLLKAEAGPLFWEMISKERAVTNQIEADLAMAAALKALDSDSIALADGEKLAFGKKEDALSYSEFSDLSLAERGSDENSIPISNEPVKDGQIVMTLWPKSKRLIPARVSTANKRVSLELVESQEKGERCFVLDEKSGALLTVSYASDGGERLMAKNPEVMRSWLCAAGSKAILKESGRYAISYQPGGRFVIMDAKTGSAYAGQLTSPPTDSDRFEFEKMLIDRLLSSKGLGAILPGYVLKRA